MSRTADIDYSAFVEIDYCDALKKKLVHITVIMAADRPAKD